MNVKKKLQLAQQIYAPKTRVVFCVEQSEVLNEPGAIYVVLTVKNKKNVSANIQS